MLKKGIAFAGNLVVDQIKYVTSYPPPHTLTTITDMARSTGGLVCNCVLDVAKMAPAVPVKAVGIVGQDEQGDYILEQLNAHPSVDTSAVLRQGSTSFTDVMTESNGSRTFFQYRGANALLRPEHFDFTRLEADILHVGYILLLDGLDCPDDQYPTAMCRVLAEAQKAGIATSVDVVSEDSQRFVQFVPPALAYTDYCIINEIESSRTTGIPLRDSSDKVLTENLPKVCRRLREMGVGRWVVIHMPELSCGMAEDGVYYQEESWLIPDGFKKSSVGAGDAFASAVLYSAYQGWPLDKAIHIAGAVAAYSLSGTGACDAILPLPQLLAEMEGYQR